MTEHTLQLTSNPVGTRSSVFPVRITPRAAMNFAAALGDGNPWYFDDTRTDGVVAHPMMAVALTWPLSASFDAHWGGAVLPEEVRARQVHYNESLHLSRPLRPGEDLAIRGEVQALRSHRAGSLIVIRYDASSSAGDPVFTEYITGLLRGVSLGHDGAGELPDVGASPAFGDPVWSAPLTIDPLAAHVYDGCTAIVFPIHTSVAFARSVGLPGPIYHGTATLGLAVKEILNREGRADPRSILSVHSGFRGMVYPGTTVTLRILGVQREDELKTIYFEVETPEGTLAIRNGRIVLRVLA